MKKILMLIGIFLLLVSVMNAGATVLTFDDITTVDNSFGTFTTYNGFDFYGIANNGTAYANRILYVDTVGSSYDKGAVSGEFTINEGYQDKSQITSSTGDDFIFNGLYVKSWSELTTVASLPGSIYGHLDGSLIWTVTGDVTNDFAWWAGVASTIDTLVIDIGINANVFDNLTFNESNGSSVPEPATMLLFGLGLLGVAGVSRKKAA